METGDLGGIFNHGSEFHQLCVLVRSACRMANGDCNGARPKAASSGTRLIQRPKREMLVALTRRFHWAERGGDTQWAYLEGRIYRSSQVGVNDYREGDVQINSQISSSVNGMSGGAVY